MELVERGPNNPSETYMVPARGSEAYQKWYVQKRKDKNINM
jgi:hypothetical protein